MSDLPMSHVAGHHLVRRQARLSWLRGYAMVTGLLFTSLVKGAEGEALSAGIAPALLPEGNPYRAVMVQWALIPEADREALDAWRRLGTASGSSRPQLSLRQQQLGRDLTVALIAATDGTGTTQADWPLIRDPLAPKNILRASVPEGAGDLRRLVETVSATADRLPAVEAVPAYLALAQLGRRLQTATAFMQWSRGAVFEKMAHEAISRRLSELDSESLRALAARWSDLDPAPDVGLLMNREAAATFLPYLQEMLVPALDKLLALPESADPFAEDATPENPTFTRDLRLSGLYDVGGGERFISLENIATRRHFTLSSGKPVDGIEFVSIDFERRRAIIRRGEREGIINLESKEITERKRNAGRETLMFLFSHYEPNGRDEISLAARERGRRWLAKLRANPRGAAGYAEELVAAYQQASLRGIAAALEPKAGPPEPPPEDPVLAMLLPTSEYIARTLHGAATRGVMLQAAINHRLVHLGAGDGSHVPTDPWSDNTAGFAREPLPEGGFLLRSVYETRPGQPVTLRVAPPAAIPQLGR